MSGNSMLLLLWVAFPLLAWVGAYVTAANAAYERELQRARLDPAQLDSLSVACHATGDTAQAIKVERMAVALLPPDANSQLRADLERRLAEFESEQEQPAADPNDPNGG